MDIVLVYRNRVWQQYLVKKEAKKEQWGWGALLILRNDCTEHSQGMSCSVERGFDPLSRLAVWHLGTFSVAFAAHKYNCTHSIAGFPTRFLIKWEIVILCAAGATGGAGLFFISTHPACRDGFFSCSFHFLLHTHTCNEWMLCFLMCSREVRTFRFQYWLRLHLAVNSLVYTFVTGQWRT